MKENTKEHMLPRNRDKNERMNKTWIELEKKVQDRVSRRILVGSLCSIGSNRRKSVICFHGNSDDSLEFT
ncbi:unnamed protein product, partial [Schistosoma rodhaini]|uniref:Uncharacterized protein n=1 Tax=Schistosoma rodhaini TaxID=6188 RepID=A0AA85GFE6_9TREM